MITENVQDVITKNPADVPFLDQPASRQDPSSCYSIPLDELQLNYINETEELHNM